MSDFEKLKAAAASGDKIAMAIVGFCDSQDAYEKAKEQARAERAAAKANRTPRESVDIRIRVHMDKDGKETGGIYLEPRKSLKDKLGEFAYEYFCEHRCARKEHFYAMLKQLASDDNHIKLCIYYYYPKGYEGDRRATKVKEF